MRAPDLIISPAITALCQRTCSVNGSISHAVLIICAEAAANLQQQAKGRDQQSKEREQQIQRMTMDAGRAAVGCLSPFGSLHMLGIHSSIVRCCSCLSQASISQEQQTSFSATICLTCELGLCWSMSLSPGTTLAVSACASSADEMDNNRTFFTLCKLTRASFVVLNYGRPTGRAAAVEAEV